MVKQILSRIGVAAFGLALGLLVLEFGLRLWFWTKGTEQQKAMYVYDSDTIDRKTYEFTGVPFLNYTLNPNYEYVNPRGMRGAAVEVPKPKGVFRILAIGGSTTYGGGGLVPKEAWPFQLQSQLKSKYGYTQVQVINMGVPMYSSLNSLINLQTRGLALEPDLIIDYDGVNDAIVRIYEDPACYNGDTPLFGMGTDQGIWHSLGQQLPSSTLYRVLAIRFGWMENPITLESRIVRTGWCPPVPDDGSKFSYRRQQNLPIYFERNLRSIAGIGKVRGIPTLFMTFAWDVPAEQRALAADPSLDGTRAMLDAVDEQNALINKIASDTGSLYLDLATEMAERAKSDDNPFFQDDHVHQTPHGSEIQAQIIAAFLDAQHLIPKPAK